ncbi:KOW motif containing protein [Paramyrothecium foliicola]|nr:KOW motif containing protein [Paramyrothecium foliicola]
MFFPASTAQPSPIGCSPERQSHGNCKSLLPLHLIAMQKLAKRVAQAERQAARRVSKANKNEDTYQRIRFRQAAAEANEEIRKNIKTSRQARKDAWELGPVAPKRDLGIEPYDALSGYLRTDWTNQGNYKPKPKIVEQRCAWAGGSKQLNLAPKDRVVILDGPDKGKIDKIKDVDTMAGTVTLENCHQAITSGSLDSVQASPMPLPVSSVRLVYPVMNPATGVTRDVIINELKAVPPVMDSPNMNFNRWTYGNKWDRLVPSLNMVIPWPETVAPELETKAGDTIRENVEERTFFYGLLSPPMPESVLDELRNKYSKFRTRHEPWYVQKKEAEEAMKNKRASLLKTMQTPLEEFHEQRRAIKAAQGEPELSDAMLEKLGEVIAKNKTTALQKAGVTELSSSSPAAPAS